MPTTHRQFLRMLLPSKTEIIEVPISASVRAAQLWCAPRLFFIPVYQKNWDHQPWLSYRTAPPERFATAVHEMWSRLDVNRSTTIGLKRVFLARKAKQLRKLRNHAAIEEYAVRRGFVIVYPQDLDFADQLALMQGARYIIGPSGSALLLSYLARPGTKLCIAKQIPEKIVHRGSQDPKYDNRIKASSRRHWLSGGCVSNDYEVRQNILLSKHFRQEGC
jgi:capsular polysaccharide biosynthesis protein